MPQELSNAPATFNICVTNMLIPVRYFGPSYFDDELVHSRDIEGKTDVVVHRIHVRQVLQLIRNHKLYANFKICIFTTSKIPLLKCVVGKHGEIPDPKKIKAITDWPVPVDFKGLYMFLGLMLYSRNYAEMTVHISCLLKKCAVVMES